MTLWLFLALPAPLMAQGETEPPAPTGYGVFAWGTPVDAIMKRVKGLKPYADAEPVLSEAKAMKRLYAKAKADAAAASSDRLWHRTQAGLHLL